MFESIGDMVSGLLMVIGAFFMLVAAIGVLRMPDLLLRMAATSKAATLGAACTLLALAFAYFEIGITARVLAGILFLFGTAPIAAHMIGRAAYSTGVPLWKGTVIDEMRGRYDKSTHWLASEQTSDSSLTDQDTTQAAKR
jgi:multicomponent Na+:H+ antiporter subunit G